MASFSFDDFFREVHDGREPFPWQRRMAELLVEGTPPDVLTVPTGLGKTSVLDAWVWALATRADDRVGRAVTTRAAFVVDRRVIVDAAFDHADKVQRALAAQSGPATAWAAQQLKKVSNGLGRPLEVVRMRGGVTWAWRWLRQPDQPAIVVGTVDQFGSRLLFRGYGVGNRLRSIDAALVGTDITTFVDEAHLSTALGNTVRTCAQLQRGAPHSPLQRVPRIVAMSATPPIGLPAESSRLTIGAADLDHRGAAERLSAVKRAELVDLPATPKGKAVDSLAIALASRARALAAQGLVVAVVVNTIDAARRTYEECTRDAQKGEPDVETKLAIGRCRNIDRDSSRDEWWGKARADRTRELDAAGLVIVATQTIEVGADLDVDCLLSEIAPLDALIQRFGRVDRLGRVGETRSWIVRQPTRSAAEANRVYGAAADRTWEWLQTEMGFATEIDFGLRAMAERLARLDGRGNSTRLADLMAPVAPAAEIYNEVLHQLARTNPEPMPDHPITTYLHGIQQPQLSVSLLWRAGITNENAHQLLADTPPTTAEAVEVPLFHALRFLSRSSTDAATATDLDVVTSPEPPEQILDAPGQPPQLVESWRVIEGMERNVAVEHVKSLRSIRPGDLIVVAAEEGGHDQFGWTGVANAGRDPDHTVTDVADLVAEGRPQLRLSMPVLESLLGRPNPGANDPADDVRSHLEALTARVRELVKESPVSRSGQLDAVEGELVRQLLDSVVSAATSRPLADHISTLCRAFGSAQGQQMWPVVSGARVRPAFSDQGVVVLDGHDEEAFTFSGLRLIAPIQGQQSGVAIDGASDSALGSSQLGREVRLEDHLADVGGRAEEFAINLGLSPELVRTVRLAGEAHDMGKADPRFQALLRGGNLLEAMAYASDPKNALAKSITGAPKTPVSDPEWRWPSGMRHEAISVALFRAALGVQLRDEMANLDSDLVEHLIASHHGWSRPLFPPVIDNSTPPISGTNGKPKAVTAAIRGKTVEARSDDVVVDWSQPQRFRQLCERYGWWGLALLEAVLRLADMAISEEGK